MNIDLRQLRHVLALDQYRNFARAASALGLTQPALSRSIQALEKSIGGRLFDRDRTRVEPTPVGERLIAEARPLLAPPRVNVTWNTCLGQFRVQVGHAHDFIAEQFSEQIHGFLRRVRHARHPSGEWTDGDGRAVS